MTNLDVIRKYPAEVLAELLVYGEMETDEWGETWLVYKSMAPVENINYGQQVEDTIKWLNAEVPDDIS